jgi:tRNA threonylcarbamoyladenosine biosynthesis protein TsaB
MRGPVLAIDAAATGGTVALVGDANLIAAASTPMRGERADRLMPAVERLLADARVAPGDLSGIVCGAGPGGFTGLRIAASIAKGLAAASGLPLSGVSSLLLVAAGTERAIPAGRYLALLDALRGEHFAARITVDRGGCYLLENPASILPTSAVEPTARAEGRTTIGPGFTIDAEPHARGLARLADSPGCVEPVHLASWEPSYGRLAEAQVRWEREHGRRLE